MVSLYFPLWRACYFELWLERELYHGRQLSPLPPLPVNSFVMALCAVMRSVKSVSTSCRGPRPGRTVCVPHCIVVAVFDEMIRKLDLHAVHVLPNQHDRQGLANDALEVGQDIA